MEQDTQTKSKIYCNAVEWVEALVFSFALIVLLYTFCFRVITVSGSSMDNTLNEGDRMVVRCIAYTPQRGDIVVVDSFSNYGAPLVKRVIGVAGDTVDIDFTTGDVSVNGELLIEPYLYMGEKTKTEHDVSFPLVVEEGCVFVLGDHRAVSLDSRSSEVGQIDTRDILGKVVLRIFPLKEFGTVA